MRLPDDFVLINTTNNQTIPLNTTLKLKVSDINIVIAVKYVDDDNDYLKDFIILMCYNGFALDHQNSSLPLYQLNNKWLVNEMNFKMIIQKHLFLIIELLNIKYMQDF